VRGDMLDFYGAEGLALQNSFGLIVRVIQIVARAILMHPVRGVGVPVSETISHR